MKFLFIHFAVMFFILNIPCYSQQTETINRLDFLNRKQGTWIFNDMNGNERMRCVFKDDSIISSRIYNLESAKAKIYRKNTENGQEPFVYYSSRKNLNGWFDTKTGDINLQEDSSSTILDTAVQYLMGIPAVYAFGKKNLDEEIDKIVAPLKRKFKNNKAVIELMINDDGLIAWVVVNLDNPNTKLENMLLQPLQSMDRWQPAFNTWEPQPYKKKIVVNF